MIIIHLFSIKFIIFSKQLLHKFIIRLFLYFNVVNYIFISFKLINHYIKNILQKNEMKNLQSNDKLNNEIKFLKSQRNN